MERSESRNGESIDRDCTDSQGELDSELGKSEKEEDECVHSSGGEKEEENGEYYGANKQLIDVIVA